MGYIYIFINSEHFDKDKELVKIGYAKDWKKRLKQANNEPNNTAVIYPYAVYETDQKLSDTKVHHIIDTLNSKLRYIKKDGQKTEYFQLSPEKAYDIFEAIAEFTGTLPKLFLINDEGNRITDDTVLPNTTKKKPEESSVSNDSNSILTNYDEHELEKDELVELLKNDGFVLQGKSTTKAHVINHKYYWANPKVSVLEKDWTFLLHDQEKKIVYVFEIPANSLSLSELRTRTVPYNNKLDLKIAYLDPDYTDRVSKTKFGPYKVYELHYGDNQSNNKIIKQEKLQKEVFETYSSSLSQIPNKFSGYSIISFEFRGEKYTAKAWKDALDVIMNYLYSKYPSEIYSMASSNWCLSDDSLVPFLSLNKERFTNRDCPRCISNSGIYFKTNYSVETLIKIMKRMLMLFNEDLDQLVFTYE